MSHEILLSLPITFPSSLLWSHCWEAVHYIMHKTINSVFTRLLSSCGTTAGHITEDV